MRNARATRSRVQQDREGVTMVWIRKQGAARSSTFSNIRDAAIVWFTSGPPPHVDATLVRQGVVSQISTPDEESIARLTALTERAPWVPVQSEAKWRKFVNLDSITDIVLEDDPPLGTAKPARKLVLSITYLAPGNPNQPQSYVCGEVHDPHLIDRVLDHLGLGAPRKEQESGEVVAVLVSEEVAPPRRTTKRKARA
jgi:hypothetical protein